MVDFDLAYRNTDLKIPAPAFGWGIISTPTEEDPAETYSEEKISFDDTLFYLAQRNAWVNESDLLRPHSPFALSEEAYRLLSFRVYGYALLQRKWCR